MVDDAPSRSPFENLIRMPQAVMDIFHDHGHDTHRPAALLGVFTLAVLLLWKPLGGNKLKAIPAVLVAVVASVLIAEVFALRIQRVEFESLGEGITFFDYNLESLWKNLCDTQIWQLAFTVAIVASSESLLTASAADQLHTGPRTAYNRELAAQGVGNVCCGLLGALPMASVIVRSSANINAGARSRWSTVLHGVWMLLFAVCLPGLLRIIPTATLAAVLVLTGIKLVQRKAIQDLYRENQSEGLICMITALAVVMFGLLEGVIIGVALSVVKLIRAFTRLRITLKDDPIFGRTKMILEGSATFVRLPKLAGYLDELQPGSTVHVDLKGLSYNRPCLLGAADELGKAAFSHGWNAHLGLGHAAGTILSRSSASA